MLSTLADLRAVGVDIVTVGQYLRPSRRHLPVARWWTPEEFESAAPVGEALGIAHVRGLAADPVELPRPRGRRDLVPGNVGHVGGAGGAGNDDGRRGPRLMERLSAGARQWRHQRMSRVRARMAALGVDALLLSLGADLPWLTGYRAMPLERLTMLVLRLEGDPVLVVPALEAPRVPEAGDLFAVRAVGRHTRTPSIG